MLKKARKGGDRNQGGERQGDRWQNTSLHCGVGSAVSKVGCWETMHRECPSQTMLPESLSCSNVRVLWACCTSRRRAKNAVQ